MQVQQKIQKVMGRSVPELHNAWPIVIDFVLSAEVHVVFFFYLNVCNFDRFESLVCQSVRQ